MADMIHELYVGIDLGTTNTLAFWMKKGRPEPFKFGESGKMLPSVIYCDGDKKMYVGEPALNRMLYDPENGVRSSKTYIGKFDALNEKENKYKNKYDCNGMKLNPTEVATEILKEVKKYIVKKSKLADDGVIHAVITVPAYFNQSQKDETRIAGENAGFIVERILVEPTAAAIAAVKEMDLNNKVFVVDLGGGTFDLSILEVDQNTNSYKTLDIDGDDHLGGDDFNRVVYEHFIDQLQSETGLDLSDVKKSGLAENEYNSMVGRLLECAENTKKELSDDTECEVVLPNLFTYKGRQISLNLILHRDDFNELCAELYDSIFTRIDKFIKKQGKGIVDKIEKIILAGGSCYIPYIQEQIELKFNKYVDSSMDRSTLVAMGACFYAETLRGVRSGDTTAQTEIEDILSHSFGISVLGDNGKDELSKILMKGDKVSECKSKIFTTVNDYQECIDIEVYEAGHDCEDIDDISKHNLYGGFVLEGIQKAVAGEPEIEVTFKFDSNGKLIVVAKDLVTQVTKTVKVEKGMHIENKNSQQPIDFVLMVDTSGSMSGSMGKANNACKELVTNIVDLNIHQMALISFDSSAFVLSHLTHDKNELVDNIRCLRAGGSTNLKDALIKANAILNESANDKYVIIVTDGYPDSWDGYNGYKRFTASMRESGINICAIGVGSGIDWNFLRTIAPEYNYAINNFDKLKDTFKVMIDKIKNMR